jgi:aryl-alcohol dehydrogenase-like predicted oxidoreductase
VFGEYLKLVKAIEQVAEGKGCSMPQVAIAWVNATGKGRKEGKPVVILIPGCTMIERLTRSCRLLS